MEQPSTGKLIAQSLGGFAFLVGVMGLALFGSAGSLGFRRGWVYLGVFAGCSLLITGYLLAYDRELLAGRVKAGPVSETQRNQKLIQSLASVLFVGVYVASGLDFRFGWSHVPPALGWVGDAGAALGFAFVFLVFRENSFTRATVEVPEQQHVVSTGPYRFVRHPMYAGAGVMLLFSPLALGSWVALPLPVLLMLVIVARLLDEEKLLRKELAGYDDYCRKVRYRLVPLVW